MLLQRTDYGEADLIVSLFTESLGVMSAIARSGRRSRRRFGGALEPLHTLRVEITERETKDLATLENAEVEVPRLGILHSLVALQAAGRALTWFRRCIAPRTPETYVWTQLCGLLGQLDRLTDADSADALLAAFGARMLSALGWALELERCVRCGKPCPPDRPAAVSASAGGIICRACGSALHVLTPQVRARLAAWVTAGDSLQLDASQASGVLSLVEDALHLHAGLEHERRPVAAPERR